MDISKFKSLYRIRPNSNDFGNHLSWFLQDIPSVKCPKGGRAAYEDAVRYRVTSYEDGDDVTNVTSSRYVKNGKVPYIHHQSL